MIPKRIFYVWLGEKKSILENICLENWRISLPGYEIFEINEQSSMWFDFDHEYKNNIWFKTIYDLRMWAYVSDYIRVKVLHDHGGVYLDTDVTVYKKFDDLLNASMFVGNTLNNFPEMAICGAMKYNIVLKYIYDFYQNDIWKSDLYIISKILKYVLNDKLHIHFNRHSLVADERVSIYPCDFFYPLHHDVDFTPACITNNTYTVHWGNSSWATRKNVFFLANKHRMPLPALLRKLEFIEKHDPNAQVKHSFRNLH